MTNKINIIAETAWHHEGDFEFMKKLVVELIDKSNVDFIKFHLSLDLDEYMDKRYSIYKTLKNWMFSTYQWNELINYAINGGKNIALLLNDKKSINFGMGFNPKLVEIHSVCLNDIHLLEELRANISKDQKIILGIGGADLYEIENAISTLNHDNIVLMFGFQNYPTRYEDVNFNKIRKIMHLYPKYEYGYADHTGWNEDNNMIITLLGAATGMQYIEKHVTNVYGQKRCDWQAAVSIDTINKIINKIILLEEVNGDGLLALNKGEKKYSLFGPMKKTALLNCDVNIGDKLTKDKVVFKRTGETSDISQLEIIERFGIKFVENLNKGSLIYKKHLSIN